MGSPLGSNYSILTGNITATSYSVSTIDANYAVFTTDIVGSKNGSGALLNLKGEVIGLIMQGFGNGSDQNTLTAIAISELKPLIEMLSNNQDIPYIGLEITTVTNTIAKENDIPKRCLYQRGEDGLAGDGSQGCRAGILSRRSTEIRSCP